MRVRRGYIDNLFFDIQEGVTDPILPRSENVLYCSGMMPEAMKARYMRSFTKNPTLFGNSEEDVQTRLWGMTP